MNFAVKASTILFNNDTAQILKELNEEQLLQVMEGVPAVEITQNQLSELDLVSLLAETKILPSKGEAKKMLAGGGIFINKEKATAADDKISADRAY